jgi:hypothetical protein
MLGDDGPEARNSVRFEQYHRFAGKSTVRFGSDEPAADTGAPAPAKETPLPRGDVSGKLEAPIGDDAAIGDRFVLTGEGGARYTARITDMKRSGRDQWNIELALGNRVVRKTVRFPLPAGMGLKFSAR